MKIKMAKNKIAVIQDPGTDAVKSLLHVTNDAFNYGIVKFACENSKYPEGTKVYFGVKREDMRMGDQSVLVMDEDNVVAVDCEGDENKDTIDYDDDVPF